MQAGIYDTSKIVNNRIVYSNCPLCEAAQIRHFLSTKDFSISAESFDIWQCDRCDFTFTQNVPVPQNAGKYYESESYISHSDRQNSLTDKLYHIARKYMLGRKWKLIQNHYKGSGSDLLDIGSGTGYFLDFIQSKSWSVTGIEISSQARSFAKKKFGIETYDPSHMATFTGPYNVITLWHVLEHLYDLKSYIKAIKRLLSSDGIICIAVPNSRSLDARKYDKYWAAYDVPRHLWHFKPNDMKRLAEEHDLSIIDMQGMPLDAFYVSILSEQYQKKSFGVLKGAISGLQSNLKAMINAENSSSVIYVLKHRQ